MKRSKLTAWGKWGVEIDYPKLAEKTNIVGVLRMDYHRRHNTQMPVWTVIFGQ